MPHATGTQPDFDLALVGVHQRGSEHGQGRIIRGGGGGKAVFACCEKLRPRHCAVLKARRRGVIFFKSVRISRSSLARWGGNASARSRTRRSN